MAGKRIKPSPKAKDVDRTGLSDRGKSTLAMLTALEDEERLTDWEQNFVSDITDRFLIKEWSLTQPQFDCLEKIYRRLN